jgi:tRNA pseudouridine55 synthase
MSSAEPECKDYTDEIQPGFLPLRKNPGCSSADVIRRLKPHLPFKKVGHTGTLDPFARGLLIVCFGRATRLSRYVMTLDKEYVGTLKLGLTTDTYDREGEIQKKTVPDDVGEKEIERTFGEYRGTIRQHPPPFSARKVRGTRMYRLARDGIFLKGEPRKVTISHLTLEQFENPYAVFRVVCSTGTYVRQLVHDIGNDLGVGACLWNLERTRIGPVSLSMAVSMDAIPCRSALREKIIPPGDMLAHLSLLSLDDDEVRRITHGLPIGPVAPDRFATINRDDPHVRLLNSTEELVGVGFMTVDDETEGTVRVYPRTVLQ